MKIIKNVHYVDGTKELGLPENCIQLLGAYLLVGTLLYIYKRTVLLGCLILFAYLGGAVAITYRAGIGRHPYLFAIVFAFLLLLAEYLSNSAVRKSIPIIQNN